MNKENLSFIVPCYNEEGNIEKTVRSITDGISGLIEDYELLLVDDCSTDRTRDVIASLALANPHVRSVYNPVNKGLGYNIKLGYELASKANLMLVPGDDAVDANSIRTICLNIGKADLVMSYTVNNEARGLGRMYLSRLYTGVVNFITGFKIQYYNGSIIFKKSILTDLDYFTNGFAMQSTIVAQLLWRGSTYIQFPIPLKVREYGGSNALRLKNVISVLKALAILAKKRLSRKNHLYPTSQEAADLTQK